jgi:hypothetical protein
MGSISSFAARVETVETGAGAGFVLTGATGATVGWAGALGCSAGLGAGAGAGARVRALFAAAIGFVTTVRVERTVRFADVVVRAGAARSVGAEVLVSVAGASVLVGVSAVGAGSTFVTGGGFKVTG